VTGGFPPRTFEWFEGLSRDNSRDYFAATREVYETDVRGALEDVFTAIQQELGGHWKVFRQQRDLRFTPDKRPYKDRTYGVLGGVTGPGHGFYAELSASGLYAGTGYYQLARDQLERFRSAVDDATAGPALQAVVDGVEAAGLELAGAELRTAPRGYARDHPRIGLLRRKAMIAGRRIPGEGGITHAAALDHLRSTWRAAEPLNAWLDAHVGPSTLPPEPARLSRIRR
jgi:uncharacterized protein (TIGR02453 family)